MISSNVFLCSVEDVIVWDHYLKHHLCNLYESYYTVRRNQLSRMNRFLLPPVDLFNYCSKSTFNCISPVFIKSVQIIQNSGWNGFSPWNMKTGKKSVHNYQDSWSSNYVKQKRCIQVLEKRKGQSTQTRGMSSTTKIALDMKTLYVWSVYVDNLRSEFTGFWL